MRKTYFHQAACDGNCQRGERQLIGTDGNSRSRPVAAGRNFHEYAVRINASTQLAALYLAGKMWPYARIRSVSIDNFYRGTSCLGKR
jgi:hypothetical protein